MGIVRSSFLIDEQGVIEKASFKVKPIPTQRSCWVSKKCVSVVISGDERTSPDMHQDTLHAGKRGCGKCRSLRLHWGSLASINKSTHVGQPVFSVLFALLSLAGDSPPASKRTKIPRKSKAVRCEAVLPEQKCSQTRKRPQRILCVFSRALTQYEGICARQNRVCPCQSTLVMALSILLEENIFTIVPAFLGSMLVNPGDHRDQRARLTFCFL